MPCSPSAPRHAATVSRHRHHDRCHHAPDVRRRGDAGDRPVSVALAVGGAAAVLLQFKPELHGFANRLGDQDLRAIMQFVLITCIILPVLPQKPAIWPDRPTAI